MTAADATTLPIAVRFARRELRGGWRGFRILAGCLALGVAAIAAAGSLRAAVHRGLEADARALLGGNLELRQPYRPPTPGQRAELARFGRVSQVVEMRAMARAGEARRLVELKGVDAAYPLAGRLVLAPALSPAAALGRRNGAWGAVADPDLLARLNLKLGDRVTVGAAAFELRAVIVKEPDRIATVLAFGPRLMVAAAAVAETGLVQPGSVVRYLARLALSPGHTAAEARSDLALRFPESAWQVRDVSQAAPAVKRVLDNIAAFLTLVGLTALLVGGIGVANAVKAYLDGRTGTIAVLKAVGAPSRVVFATYGLVIGVMALGGILAGLAVGGSLPLAAVALAGDRLPVAVRAKAAPLLRGE